MWLAVILWNFPIADILNSRMPYTAKKLSPKCEIFLKLPPNSGYLSITDYFFKTRRCPLFRVLLYLQLSLFWSFENVSHSPLQVTFINPFVPNVPFLYPLKTSENLIVFCCFLGVEKGRIGKKWVNPGVGFGQQTLNKISNAGAHYLCLELLTFFIKFLIIIWWCFNKIQLTNLFQMHPFSSPWKHQKTLRISFVYGGLEKGHIGNK